MSHIPNTQSTPSEVELLNIVINSSIDTEGNSCWEKCFSTQFPIVSMFERNGMYIMHVGSPHEGYSIETHLVHNNMHGKSYLYTNEKLLVAELYIEDGEAEGPCTLYDTSSSLYFEGFFKNGYRSGKGKEYDREGKVIFEGYFDLGKRLYINPLHEMSGYWKEYDEKGKLLNISKRNEKNGEIEGICYYYDENGNISHIVEIKKGIEIEYNGYCKLYDEPHKVWFEGFVKNGRKLNLIRSNEMSGYWKEYDENGKLLNISKRNEESGDKEGICYYYDENGQISHIVEVKKGIEIEYNGYCKLYDEPHKVWFEGFVKNGYRHGKGKEYSSSQKKVMIVLYEDGKKLKLKLDKKNRGYRKE